MYQRLLAGKEHRCQDTRQPILSFILSVARNDGVVTCLRSFDKPDTAAQGIGSIHAGEH